MGKLDHENRAIRVKRNYDLPGSHGTDFEAEDLVFIEESENSGWGMSYDETVALRKALKVILKAHDADKAKLEAAKAEAAKPKLPTNRELVRALPIDTVFTFNGRVFADSKYIRGAGEIYRRFGSTLEYPLDFIKSSTGITVIHPKPVPEARIYMVGDEIDRPKDRRHWCASKRSDGQYLCTRDAHHDGDHVRAPGGKALQVWA